MSIRSCTSRLYKSFKHTDVFSSTDLLKDFHLSWCASRKALSQVRHSHGNIWLFGLLLCFQVTLEATIYGLYMVKILCKKSFFSIIRTDRETVSCPNVRRNSSLVRAQSSCDALIFRQIRTAHLLAEVRSSLWVDGRGGAAPSAREQIRTWVTQFGSGRLQVRHLSGDSRKVNVTQPLSDHRLLRLWRLAR